MRRAFFLEEYPTFFSKCDGDIISLDPRVSQSLSRKKTKYNILEDYYDEKKLRVGDDKYFIDQLDWFNAFDVFLKKNITYCGKYGIPLAKSNYLRIKYFIDTVVINSFILRSFFGKNTEVNEVVYVKKCCADNDNFSIFDFKANNRAVFGSLLELFCKKYGVNFKSVISGKGKDTLKSNKTNSYVELFKMWLKVIRNFKKFNKHEKFFNKSTSVKKINVFFMHAGSPDIDIPIAESIRGKARVYVLEKNKILREDSIFRKTISSDRFNGIFFGELKSECEECAKILDKHSNLIRSIIEICKTDISSIVLPFLKCFVSGDVPHMIESALKMKSFYENEDIDYVFARGNTDRDSIGPLVAAKYMAGPKSICIQHSSFAVDAPVFKVFETETYDYIITRDCVGKSFYENSRFGLLETNCEVVTSPYYLKNFKKNIYRRNKPTGRETVIYVNKKFPDRVRCFNNMIYSLTWYYQFQVKLIDFFATKEKTDFIYKYARTSNQSLDEKSIVEYINEKICGNIRAVQTPFLVSLRHADRVIVDYPSGALFEAAVCGKPVLCMYPDYLRTISKADDIFGMSLRPFSDEEEAMEIIDEFLRSDPGEYIVDMPLLGDSFSDVLIKMHEGQF